MPVAKHAFVSAKGDGADATVVRPSNWNADHQTVYTVQTKAADYTVAIGDDLVRCSGTFTLTLPAASGTGKTIGIVLDGAGTVTIARTGTDTIGGQTSASLATVNDMLFVTDEAAGAWGLCYPAPAKSVAYSVRGNNSATAGRVADLSSLIIGTPAFTPSAVADQYTASSPTFFQKILQNTSANPAASADFVAENDQGTDSDHYVDLGINSSTYSGSGQMNIAGGGYVYSQGGDLTLGTNSANAVHLVAGNASADAITIRSDNQAICPNLLEGCTTTTTSAGTTTLTDTSNYTQLFTGTNTQTVVMPVTTTVDVGLSWQIVNTSTGAITVNSSGSNLIATVPAGATAVITCVLASGTTAASWSVNMTALTSTAPSAVTPDASAAAGSSTYAAKLDHQHGLATATTAAAATPLALSAAGTSRTAPSRGGHTHQCPGGIQSTTSQVSVGPSSTTETTIATVTLPTNFLLAGTSFRFKFQGTLQLQATSGTLTIRMYIGSTAGQTLVLTSQTGAVAASYCEFEGMATVRTTGSSGTYITTGKIAIFTTDSAMLNARQGGASTTTVNTTASTPVVKMTAQFATSSSTNILLVQNATIEIVKM
jgi:hypothetical protein